MTKTHTVNIAEGQTLLLYKDKSIILRKEYAISSSITTPWSWFTGTSDEVDAKIKELSLGNIKKPLAIKPPSVVAKMHRVGLIRRIANYFKQLF